MKNQRYEAASLVLGKSLWIIGGKSNDGCLKSTEYISQDSKQEDGPDLPIKLYKHVAIKINETVSMITGGSNCGIVYNTKTWFYLHLSGQWIDGPSLLQPREMLSVGSITDSVTQEQFIIITGGYHSSLGLGHLKSTEILDKEGTTWKPGELL